MRTGTDRVGCDDQFKTAVAAGNSSIITDTEQDIITAHTTAGKKLLY
jgi:hypothetical protein